jgi:hypothetical protein
MENNEVASQASSQLESAVHELANDQVPELDSALGGPISKNAQKRLIKAQKREQQKVERRAREKAAKAAKKEAKRKRELEGEKDEDRSSKKRKLDDGVLDEGDEVEEHSVQKQQPKEKIPFGSKIVIDLGFDDKMTERVRISSSIPTEESKGHAMFNVGYRKWYRWYLNVHTRTLQTERHRRHSQPCSLRPSMAVLRRGSTCWLLTKTGGA